VPCCDSLIKRVRKHVPLLLSIKVHYNDIPWRSKSHIPDGYADIANLITVTIDDGIDRVIIKQADRYRLPEHPEGSKEYDPPISKVDGRPLIGTRISQTNGSRAVTL
jgi:hypothetical protein